MSGIYVGSSEPKNIYIGDFQATKAYVGSNLVFDLDGTGSSGGNTGIVTGGDTLRDKVVATAKTQLGVPYLWGGTTPSGFDCSGFVQWVYKQHNITITRTTYTQIGDGVAVSKDQLKPADLVFPHEGHVQMYIGNGNVIHAPQTGDVVKISPLPSTIYACRRIITDEMNTPPTTSGVAQSNKASASLIYFCKTSEGFASQPYKDSVGVSTIGYGLTGNEYTQAVNSGLPLSEAFATQLLVSYLNSNYYMPVYNTIKDKGITPTQRECDAFADFAYNLGVGAFQTSTLLKVYVDYVNGGRKDKQSVKDQFMRWVYAGGVKLQGLVIRREKEYNIFVGNRVEGYDTILPIQKISTGGTITNGGAKPY